MILLPGSSSREIRETKTNDLRMVGRGKGRLSIMLLDEIKANKIYEKTKRKAKGRK